MSEKLVTLIKASNNLMKVVTKSVQMTTIPRASKMNWGHRRIFSLVQRCDMDGWCSGGGGGGGDSHIKRGGMLVVSLSSVNFGFWPHLGCFGQNAIICSRENLLSGCARRNIKVYFKLLYFFTQVKVLDDNVFAIIKSRCIFYFSVL